MSIHILLSYYPLYKYTQSKCCECTKLFIISNKLLYKIAPSHQAKKCIDICKQRMTTLRMLSGLHFSLLYSSPLLALKRLQCLTIIITDRQVLTLGNLANKESTRSTTNLQSIQLTMAKVLFSRTFGKYPYIKLFLMTLEYSAAAVQQNQKDYYLHYVSFLRPQSELRPQSNKCCVNIEQKAIPYPKELAN